jgi:hypothetical protein
MERKSKFSELVCYNDGATETDQGVEKRSNPLSVWGEDKNGRQTPKLCFIYHYIQLVKLIPKNIIALVATRNRGLHRR